MAVPNWLENVADGLSRCQAIVCLPPLLTMPVIIVAPIKPVTGVVPATVCAALNKYVRSLSYRL